MKGKIAKTKLIIYITVILIIIQLLRFGLKQILFLFIERTDYSDHVASMVGMIVLSIFFVLIARKQKIELSVFPQNFNKWYVIGTGIVIVLLVATPSNYLDGVKAIVLLIYGSIVTPVFEELIFRGYAWNKLENVFNNKWIVYLFSVIMFGLWHIGYIDSIAFRTENGLLNAMIWKVIVGLCYGVILGGLRLKTKNCYSTILLHGVMNIFGR